MCHHVLDVLIAVHWLLRGRGVPYNEDARKSLAPFVEAEFLVGDATRHFKEQDPEIVVRAWYIWLEVQFPEKPQSADSVEPLIGAAEHALDLVREDCPRRYPLFSPLLGMTTDQSLYIPYRSLFHILLGRLRLVAASTSASSREWAKAYRDFELARARVGDNNMILFAMADLFSAKAGLAYASVFARGQEPTREGCSALIAKLRSASGYLQRCLTHLTSCPRYILIWREFYTLATLYQYERLTLIYSTLRVKMAGGYDASTSLPQDEGVSPSGAFAELVRRARRGATVLRHLLDYSPAGAVGHQRECGRLWLRLTHACLNIGMVLGLWAAARKRQSEPVRVGDVVSDMLRCWMQHCEGKGLRLSADAKAFIEDNASSLLFEEPGRMVRRVLTEGLANELLSNLSNAAMYSSRVEAIESQNAERLGCLFER